MIMLRFLVASFVGCFIAVSAFGQTNLFEKQNLADWDFFVVKEGVKAAEVFSFADNGQVLRCTGQPFGSLATKESYKNFKFTVEWRWPEGEKPTNSGVFLGITEQPKDSFLPKAFEVQLQHKSAGDIWAFHGRKLTDSANRFQNAESPDIGKFSGVKKILDMEKEPGQWNTMDILCNEGLIVVAVNGKIVNWTTGAESVAGRIGLQSEGGPIEFRNAVLTTLP
jgi:hypothetical protein